MESGKNPSQQPSARHTEEGERFNRTLFSALDALEAGKIPYGLIGGVAASGLGRPRSTHDIDIFVRPEDAEGALDSLNQFGFKTEKTDPVWLYKAWKENILVDIIFKSSGDIYFDDEMSDKAKVIHFHGREVRAVSPEDLIIIKCAVHNEIGPHHWHDALAILSHAQLDWNYLLKRARRAARRLLALLIYAQSNDIWVPNWVIYDLFNTVFEDAKHHGVPQKSRGVEKGPGAPRPAQGQGPGTRGTDAYIEGRIKEALSQDSRTGSQDIKIVIGDHHILVRGESASEFQRFAIEEVVRKAAPGFQVDNQITVRNLPGPEGAEYII